MVSNEALGIYPGVGVQSELWWNQLTLILIFLSRSDEDWVWLETWVQSMPPDQNEIADWSLGPC